MAKRYSQAHVAEIFESDFLSGLSSSEEFHIADARERIREVLAERGYDTGTDRQYLKKFTHAREQLRRNGLLADTGKHGFYLRGSGTPNGGSSAPSAPTESTDEILTRKWREQKERCGFCAKPLGLRTPMHLDHINPRAKGGGDIDGNLWVLCQRCNLRKTDKTLSEFVGENWDLMRSRYDDR